MKTISINFITLLSILGILVVIFGNIWIAALIIPLYFHAVYVREKKRLITALCLVSGEVILFKKIEKRQKSSVDQFLYDIGELHIFTNKRIFFIHNNLKQKTIEIIRCIHLCDISELKLENVDIYNHIHNVDSLKNTVVSITENHSVYQITFKPHWANKLKKIVNSIQDINPNIKHQIANSTPLVIMN